MIQPLGSEAVATGMGRRQYPNPPVHEVILDDRFREPLLNDHDLDELKTAVGERFGTPSRAERIEVAGELGSSGSSLQSRTRFMGWDFTVAEPRWLLRAYSDRLTLHLARPGNLPEGEYLGWETVRARYHEVNALMERFYGGREGRRTALRYLNRIVVPSGSELEDWFTISPPSPEFLADAHAFHVARTWETVRGHPGFSATVRLSKLQIGTEQLPPDSYPVLLDIEIFNLWVRDAPEYSELSEWFERAHGIENDIFEVSVKDSLRARFE